VPLIEEHLLIQPSVGVGVTPARSTVGVKGLITQNPHGQRTWPPPKMEMIFTVNGKFLVVSLQSLKEHGVHERLTTGSKDQRYIELMRIMERESRKLRQAA